ncbi:MAG: hypothetical protein NTW21_27475 [Verrucomicrobia bacterium]|nr:hypothetical protein [Verrucomicrobiota bacterium]
MNAAFIEDILKKILEKFPPDTPITMTFHKAHFSSGHDLKDFAFLVAFVSIGPHPIPAAAALAALTAFIAARIWRRVTLPFP